MEPGFLSIPPRTPVKLTQAGARHVADEFDLNGGTVHSAGAGTLQVVLDHCHRNRIAYELTCGPGGFFARRLNSPPTETETTAGITDEVARRLELGEEFKVVYSPGSGYEVGPSPEPEFGPGPR